MPAFTSTQFPVLETPVHRLGLAPNKGMKARDVAQVLAETDVGYVFWTLRMPHATGALKAELARDRDRFIVATGPTTAFWGRNLERYVDKALRALDTDHLDILQLHWLGVSARLNEDTLGTLMRLRESGKVRAIGTSIHDRPRAGGLAAESELDMLMVRYNAAHPGAEQDIFAHLNPTRPRAIVAYTATRWRKLLKRPRGWTGAVPTAGHCYRFCLSNAHVHVVLCGAQNLTQWQENETEIAKGPLSADEDEWIRDFGRVVHG
jgi:aryl-alcohol dehydrogenase-like predicted oxidoreductase